MASDTIRTHDHDQIRQWAERHDGQPARVRGTENGGDDGEAGVLRIDLPQGAGEDVLEHISWEDWFATFEESSLDALYQDHKADGEDSTFFKLVRREE